MTATSETAPNDHAQDQSYDDQLAALRASVARRDFEEAARGARALAVEAPERVEAVQFAIQLGHRVGNPKFEKQLTRSLDKECPDSVAAGFARALIALGQRNMDDAAEKAAALSQDHPLNLDIGILIADIRRRGGDIDGAIEALSPLLVVHPEMARLHHLLASLMLTKRDGIRAAAFARCAGALGFSPAPVNLQLLGRALVIADEPEEAVEVLRRADAEAPGKFETLAPLSAALFKKRDYDGALDAGERAFDLRPYTVRGPAKQSEVSLTVLVPELRLPDFFDRSNINRFSRYNYLNHVKAPDVRFVHTPISERTPDRLAAAGLAVDLICNNAVVDETVNAEIRENYQTIIKPFSDARAPEINGLDAVAACGREQNSRKFAAETAFIFPKTRRISTRGRKIFDIIGEVDARFDWPIILRPTQTNESKGAALISSPEMMRERLKEMPLAEYYVIQFHECRDEKDVSRQCRGVVIGDTFHIDRYNAMDDWQSHGDLRRRQEWWDWGMADEEQALMADPASVLGFDPKEVFAPIFAKTPLEIYGFDFGRTREGTPIIFEVNAAMNLFNQDYYRLFPYLRPHYDMLNDLVTAHMKKRAFGAGDEEDEASVGISGGARIADP